MPRPMCAVTQSEISRALALGVSRAPGAMAMFDRDMRYIAANDRWHRDYRLGSESLVGRSHYEVFPEIPQHWRDAYRRGLRGEVLRSEDDIVVRAAGDAQQLKWTIEPWHEADGSVGGILIATEDRTDADRAEAERVLAGRELQALFEQRVAGIIVAHADGTVIRCNERYLELVARDAAEVVGHAWDRSVHEADLASIRDGVSRAFGGEARVSDGRHRQILPDGSVRWFKHALSAIDQGGRASAKMVIFLYDASERVDFEQRLRESDRLASLGMLGASLGHDMCNVLLPLHAHLNAIEALVRGVLENPSLLGSIRGVREGLSYLQRLADSMHYLGMVPADGEAAEYDSTDVHQWWSVVEPMFRSVFPSHALLEVQLEERLPEIAIGAQDLTRLVLNLLLNSSHAVVGRHGPKGSGGKLLFTAQKCRHSRRKAVRLVVGDNGVGMDESVRARAGEPFFTTRPDGRGTGLGLSTVRRLVERSRGTMSIDSVLGAGTQVRLLLPAASTVADQDPHTARAAPR
jgi:two-component system, cell cycle sensor histidine kinase and response regulator CckA